MALLEDFLTRDEIAAELGVSPRTILRWQNQTDGIPYVMLGGRILYRRCSIGDWLQKREKWPNPTRRRS